MPKMREFTVRVTIKGEIEAESNEEAQRIADGVISKGSIVTIYEGDPSDPDDEISGEIASMGDVVIG